jgi:hypothetical protein
MNKYVTDTVAHASSSLSPFVRVTCGACLCVPSSTPRNTTAFYCHQSNHASNLYLFADILEGRCIVYHAIISGVQRFLTRKLDRKIVLQLKKIY